MPRQRKLIAESKANDNPTVGFRLEPDLRQVLGERAGLIGVSVHDLAKLYVTERLFEEQERIALHEAVKVLHKNMEDFRFDFLHAVRALLTSAGKVSKDRADQWVNESLDRE